ncbi:MFS transporter [Candidatus Woesearchaeota archaeon]|nr:MFS transporter [Candidatus Woesearchaeota archaeon]
MFTKEEFVVMWKYYFASFLIGITTLTGAYMFLFFKNDLGMSYFMINLALFLFLVVDVIFEIPTGAIGDFFGRKTQAIIGTIILAGGGFALYFSNNGLQVILSFAGIGIGWAFFYGAREAWVVDKLKLSGKENCIQNFFAHSQFFFTFGGIIGFVAASYLATIYNLRILWLIDALVTLIILIPLILEKEVKPADNGMSIIKIIRETITLIRNNSNLLILMLISFFTAFNIGVVAGYQPFLLVLGMPLFFFGIKEALKSVFSGVSFLFSHKFTNFPKQILVVTSILSTVFIIPLLFVQEDQWIIAFVLTLLPAFLVVSEPLRFDYQNTFISPHLRSSTLSVFGLATSLGNIFGYLLGGFALDYWGPQIAIVGFSFVFLINAALYLKLPFKSKKL